MTIHGSDDRLPRRTARTALRLFAAACLPLSMVAAQGGDDTAGPRPQAAFDVEAFVGRLREAHGLTDERCRAFLAEVSDGVSPAVLAEELLRDEVPAFDRALVAVADEDPRAAVLLANLASAEATEPHLRAYARYHLGRVFLDADEPRQAAELFLEHLRNDRGRTPLDADTYFFYASSLAAVPEAEAAAEQFDAFLSLFPDAPERLRAVAAQRAAELRKELEFRAADQIGVHELADEMRRIGREIRSARTGEQVQTRQLEITKRLEEIVEKMKEMESQSSGAPSGNQQSRAPASDSSLPEGESRIGRLESVTGTSARWGDMNDRERREIQAEVEEKMPPHYKRWLEEYYRKLNRDGRRR